MIEELIYNLKSALESLFNCVDNIAIFDVLLAIIAINMTVIGLTSLAESKYIAGIEYGKYLTQKYKITILGWKSPLKMMHLLKIFGVINIFGLVLLFFANISIQILLFTSLVLIISLVFAIKYFFTYILNENDKVKAQILDDELLCLYHDGPTPCEFEADLITNVHSGEKGKRKLSASLINYFDNYNSDSSSLFLEVFGLDSIIYDDSTHMKKVWQKKFNVLPYDYHFQEINEEAINIKHISHEFYQFFRSTEIQEKWLVMILKEFLAQHKDSNTYEYKINHLIRAIAHVNSFGQSEILYKYKFVTYIDNFVRECFEHTNSIQNLEVFKKREECLFRYLFIMYASAISKYYTRDYFITALNKCVKILLIDNDYLGLMTRMERLQIFAQTFIEYLIYEKCVDFFVKVLSGIHCSKIELEYVKSSIKSESDNDEEYIMKTLWVTK